MSDSKVMELEIALSNALEALARIAREHDAEWSHWQSWLSCKPNVMAQTLAHDVKIARAAIESFKTKHGHLLENKKKGQINH